MMIVETHRDLLRSKDRSPRISAFRAMHWTTLISLLAVVSVFGVGRPADASTITFRDKASFLSSTCPETLESFENTPVGTSSDPLLLNGLTVTSTVPFVVN